jgi:thiamine monophosphate kinase
VRLVVDLDRIPVADGVGTVAAALRTDPRHVAVTGGEDFELLVCVPPHAVGAAEAAGVVWVGAVDDEGPPDLILDGDPSAGSLQGYEHP